MYPELFHISGLSSYWVMVCVGIAAAFALFRVLTFRIGLTESAFRFYAITLIISVAVGLVFARLFQMLYNVIETGEVGTGITFLGGLIGGTAFFFAGCALFGKKHRSFLVKTVNVAMPCVAIGHFFGRIGCFLAGCCYGIPTDGILGVRFVTIIDGVWTYGEPRIPTQLIEALLLVLLAISLILLIFRLGLIDYSCVIYLYVYGFFRFLIEFLRDDARGAFLLGLSPSQIICLLMLALGIVLNILIYRRKHPTHV